MEKKITPVVAALIWREGRFLACQRPENKARALMWEFVGGKVEPGEMPQAALRRECREELAIDVEVGELFMEVVHPYPDITVRLSLYHARISRGEPQLLEHRALRWVTPEEVDELPFCPADREILARIRQEYGAGEGE